MPILRYILFGLLLLVSSHTQGASLSYITKVEDSNAGAKNIWFTIAYADENDATPNPCYGAAYCKYAFMVGSKRKIGAVMAECQAIRLYVQKVLEILVR